MITDLYLVKFSDGATYATGPQTHPDGYKIPGGVLAFVERDMAVEVASTIDSGTVVLRNLDKLIERAQETGIPLYIRHGLGTCVLDETIPDQPAPASLVRIEGDERERLLQVERQQGSVAP